MSGSPFTAFQHGTLRSYRSQTGERYPVGLRLTPSTEAWAVGRESVSGLKTRLWTGVARKSGERPCALKNATPCGVPFGVQPRLTGAHELPHARGPPEHRASIHVALCVAPL